MSINYEGAQDLKGLLLSHKLCRSASCPLNDVRVRGDNVVRNEESTTNAQRLAIRVVHRQENN
jgi:hypothetical protein